MKFTALILAAGKGVRMKSELPKVLHPVLGKPMVEYVIDAARSVGADPVTVIIGFGRERMREALVSNRVSFVEQTEQLGTGHAVQCYARSAGASPENLLVICGDTPLISRETLKKLVDTHEARNPSLTMLTLDMTSPGGYGRILRDSSGNVTAIREAKDCTEAQRAIREVNLAVYLFKGPVLFESIGRLKNNNKQGEYYLTDVVEMLSSAGHPIEALKENDETSTLGINSRQDLARVAKIMEGRVIDRLMTSGVSIVDPQQTYIEPDVEIGPESVIWPGTVLRGRCRVGSRCRIGPGTTIISSEIGDDVQAEHCLVRDSRIASETVIPPFSEWPPGAKGSR